MDYTPIRFNNFDERERYFRNLYTHILGKVVIDKLITDGFLTAPASTKYHGNYAGGLFDHSVNVARVLCNLTQLNSLIWKNDENQDAGDDSDSPLLVGILHDLCKIDQYKKISEGSEFPYMYDNSPLIKGHGTKSAFYVWKYGITRVTEEELACIIYHMGAFTSEKEWGDYNNAVKMYPNVLWTHTADMIASQIMEV